MGVYLGFEGVWRRGTYRCQSNSLDQRKEFYGKRPGVSKICVDDGESPTRDAP